MRFAFRSISWLLLALWATLAFVGQGLHALPGCGHPPHAHRALPLVERCCHAHCGHALRQAQPTPPADGFRAIDFSSGEHDCPLCSFFALAAHFSAASAESPPAAVFQRQAAFASCFASSPSALHAPRGPPVL